MSISAKQHRQSVRHAKGALRPSTFQPYCALVTVSRVQLNLALTMRRLAHLEAADTHGKQEATDLQITFYFTELKVWVFPLWGSAVVYTSLRADRPSFLFNQKLAMLHLRTRKPKLSLQFCTQNPIESRTVYYWLVIMGFHHFKKKLRPKVAVHFFFLTSPFV